ncbi:hypothetical protein E4P41_08545 [Geodermatophilus sp. DF01-2]|uniref:hypothetical protein n=1 Tax=Geodermatophilus sp. DF01-2 TaxID=2559610 RepID=UPI00107401F0|nr:hypothetical protein [Geodermatophilus sp. DF01_2]TFV62039.1 hypothetical protein E4P41_08545 [Geodermatophilus sp. DF01_2]
MKDVSLYRSSELVPSDVRLAARTVSRHHVGGQARIAKIDVDTDVVMAKIDALTTATGSAMSNMVRVAQVQRQLEQLVPEASGRLAMLADDHALAMSDAVADLRRDMRRR